MALPARKFERLEAENSMEPRIARLEATTEHIQSEVNDLRHDMKGFRQELKEYRQETKEMFGKLEAKFEQLQKSFEEMKIARVWDRVWMLLAMGTLLGVMARGFQWI